MSKKIIRITESQLQRVIEVSAKSMLSEEYDPNAVGTQSFQAIGFAVQYYTLWDVMIIRNRNQYGAIEETRRYAYIKNISKDKETAMERYPDAVYMEELRGKTQSWASRPEVIWDTTDVFRFGKYVGTNLSSCPDTDYITWYYNHIFDEDHKKAVLGELENRGYQMINGTLFSPEELAEKKKEEQLKNEIIQQGERLIHITYNPDENGDVTVIEDGIRVTYRFENVVEREYNGFSYYLPALKGKGKIVKNKDILAKIWYGQKDSQFIEHLEDFDPDNREYMYVEVDGRELRDPHLPQSLVFTSFEDAKARAIQEHEESPTEHIAVTQDGWTIFEITPQDVQPRLYITDFQVIKNK